MELHSIMTAKCPICKKEFVPAPMHIYKLKKKANGCTYKFCTYGCFRKAQKNTKKWRSAPHG